MTKEPVSKVFCKKILRHQAALPSVSLVGFYLVFLASRFSRKQIEGLGDSEEIRDETKAKARAAFGVQASTTWEDREAVKRGALMAP